MKTIDLDIARELQQICKEKGIELPEPYLGWYYQEITETYITLTGHGTLSEYIAPAYTLDELLEWLPRVIQKNGNFYEQTLQFSRTLNTYRANYDCEYDDIVLLLTDSCWHPNPANAACKLLIWLIKEGLI